MKRLILIVQMTLFLSNGYAQTPFDTIPIKFFYSKSSNNFLGWFSRDTFTELVNKEVCINGIRYKKHDLKFLTFPYNSIYYRYDSLKKKIVYREGGSGNSYKEYELFNFKHKIGDYNLYRYRLDSIDSVFIFNRNYKLFFFSFNNYYKEVWLEDFGSISNWAFSELLQIRNISDGATTITIDSIVFGNKYFYRRTNDFKNFDTMDSATYKKYKMGTFIKEDSLCGKFGNLGQKEKLDSCMYDSDYMTNFMLVLISRGSKCGDSAKLDIIPKYENKIVNWITSKTQKIEYPDTFSKNGREIIFDVEVMNKDSSCKLKQKYSINTNCTYCDNPKNNYKLSISIDNDSLFCDTVVKLSSNIKAGDTFFYKYSPSFSQLILKDTNTYRLTFNISNGKCISKDTIIDFKYYCKSSLSALDKKVELTLYPNPVEDGFWLKTYALYPNTKVIIYNALGTRVASYPIATLSSSPVFYDIHHLANGIYYVEAHTSDKVFRRKIDKP